MANLHLVTGYAGEAHITSADHGSLNAAIFGEENCVLNRGRNLSASAIASNTVRVLDGDLLLQGRHVRLEGYVDLTITSGTQGRKRHDLIVARYTKNSTTGVEECNLVVIKGTVSTSPSDPAYTEGDILDGTAIQTNFPLYRVVLNGVNLESVTPLFEPVEIIKVPVDGIIPAKHLPALSSSYTSNSYTTPANSQAVKLLHDKVTSYEEKSTTTNGITLKSYKYGRVVLCNAVFDLDDAWTGKYAKITLHFAPWTSISLAVSVFDYADGFSPLGLLTITEGNTAAELYIKKKSTGNGTVVATFTYIAAE